MRGITVHIAKKSTGKCSRTLLALIVVVQVELTNKFFKHTGLTG